MLKPACDSEHTQVLMLMYGNSLSLHCFSGSCPHICTNALALYSHFSLNYLLQWSVSLQQVGAQGCKGRMHYTSIAISLWRSHDKSPAAYQAFWLRQMFFNMLEGRCHLPLTFPPHTSAVTGSWWAHWQTLSWIIMSKAQGLWCGIWWSVYTLIHFPILAFMACSGDCESASEYYEASMKECSLNYCSAIIYSISHQSKPVSYLWNMKIVGKECLWCSVSYNESEWAWTTIVLQIWCTVWAS